MLNYIFQVIVSFFALVLFSVYTLMILAIINHCCLMFDELTIMIQSLKINPEEDSLETGKSNQLNLFIERSQVIFTRHEEAKKVLQFHFFVEFTLLSFMICFSLYANLIETTPLSCMMMITSVLQLLIFCFLGERVNDRIERLEATVYDFEWYSIDVKQQKAILLILMKIRETRGFNGIFNSVDMETFVQVRPN